MGYARLWNVFVGRPFQADFQSPWLEAVQPDQAGKPDLRHICRILPGRAFPADYGKKDFPANSD